MTGDGVAQTVIGGLGLVLIGVYVWYTYHLFKAGKCQIGELETANKLAAQDLEARTRAWLGVEEIQNTGPPPQGVSEWAVVVKNFGMGVAEDVDVGFSSEFPGFAGSGRKAADMPDASLIVLPGQARRFAIRFNEDECVELQKTDGQCRLRLEIVYSTGKWTEVLRLDREWIARDSRWAVAKSEQREVRERVRSRPL